MKNLVLILFVICLACNNKPNTIATFHITPTTDFLDASKVFNDFHLIPLEGNENSIIGEVSKISERYNKIFVLDSKQNKLLIFSKNGKFQTEIFKEGRGPNEYLTLDDFIFTKVNYCCYPERQKRSFCIR